MFAGLPGLGAETLAIICSFMSFMEGVSVW